MLKEELMLEKQIEPQNDIQLIVDAIVNKNKVGFRHNKKKLYQFAKHFSPAYRDFILKVIKNTSLKIEPDYRNGFMTASINDNKKRLSKRVKTHINTHMSDIDCLPHELGHAVDLWFGSNLALSSCVLIEGDKTLHDILIEEFNAKKKGLFEMMMVEFKDIINSTINKDAYDILLDNFQLYRELLKLPVDPNYEEISSLRRKYQKKLYKSGFVETYYQFYTKKCYAILNSKYSPILDALSAHYNFDGFCLRRHSAGYYENDEHLISEEFFANVFAAKVTSKHMYFDNLIKHLPHSFNAFEKLFVIFYDHIQNNKRFTDVKIREVN